MAKKKPVAKSTKKPTTKKRRKITLSKAAVPTGLIQLEDIHRKINFIQLERETVRFKVSVEDAPMVANVLKDAGLILTRIDSAAFSTFEVGPGEPVLEGSNALEGLEEISDEIPEEGQIFD